MSAIRSYNVSLLQQLESEAIYVLRETAAQFRNPALLCFRHASFGFSLARAFSLPERGFGNFPLSRFVASSGLLGLTCT